MGIINNQRSNLGHIFNLGVTFELPKKNSPYVSSAFPYQSILTNLTLVHWHEQ